MVSTLGADLISRFSNALLLNLPDQPVQGTEWQSTIQICGTASKGAKVRVPGFQNDSRFNLWANLREAGFDAPYPKEVSWMADIIPAALEAAEGAATTCEDIDEAFTAGKAVLRSKVKALSSTPHPDHLRWLAENFRTRCLLRINEKEDPFDAILG